ncbi:hypothetical protein FKG94_21815 [Exilibacterium tricleocarpae]|uniref:Uncharacterized protein n=1 Tax=Exilibacterium tricleocarpae TaxID=2591008 RepID=A0A545SYY2_9GAMM|nr:hypothetical protein [Exilibacterium tricleocarpae]TQV70161.1 hypothetical protein FKG94_21815 [Exilibacterium tricleocarpae]
MKYFVSAFALAAMLSTSACGYLLHPERVGQKSGRIDPTIVLLDAAGLLIGILPGVVAFAVDFTTGAIYLQPGQKSAIERHTSRPGDTSDLELEPVAKVDLTLDRQRIARQLSQLLGQPVDADAIEFYRPTDTHAVVMASRGPNRHLL